MVNFCNVLGLRKLLRLFKPRRTKDHRHAVEDHGGLLSQPAPDDMPDTSPKEHFTSSVNNDQVVHAPDNTQKADDSEAKTAPEVPDDTADKDISRADWETILAIPQTLFNIVLAKHLPNGSQLTEHNFRFVEGFEGGFHHVRLIEVLVGPHAGKYVVKVPSTGTAACWIDLDAYMLRNEAKTMSYIRKHTSIAIPEVIGFSDAVENELGAPYIIMRAAEGVPSYQIWFEQDKDGDPDMENAGMPSEELMQKRVTFLRSLARTMSSLKTLEFKGAGLLDFDEDEVDPDIGPWYLSKSPDELQEMDPADLATAKSMDVRRTFDYSHHYHQHALDKTWPYDNDTTPMAYVDNGRRFVMQTIINSEPFTKVKESTTDKETFVLHHDDLDFQNIYCDPETGEVTSIIDWDKCRTVPHYLGYASLPIFLTLDWLPHYSIDEATHLPWDLDIYRQVYAEAMIEATGPEGDGKYTLKSAMYAGVHAALYGSSHSGSIRDLIQKILPEIPQLRRLGIYDILQHLGERWLEGKLILKLELEKLMAPAGSS